jgi:hypothetical protein
MNTNECMEYAQQYADANPGCADERNAARKALRKQIEDTVAAAVATERERLCADEITWLRAQVAEWEKLRDPVVLHVSLLRGIPCRLDRTAFLHLAGDETSNVANNRLPGTSG